MILQNTKEPKIIDQKNNSAVIEIQGLYPGYGTTIGNSLRRVMISSLQGSAITQVKIKGVNHEFSTIPGVLEDVIVLIMNLKQMRFKQYDSEPQTAFLKVKGERKVLASDFKYPTQVEIINPDCHIFTLTDKKAEVEMEIQIEQGIGYEPVENRKTQKKKEIGVILVDAIFSPIKKINFKVENMRVGEKTDYEKLSIEIETDGTILPEQVFTKACTILAEQFSFLGQTFKEQENGLQELKLSDKLSKALEQNNIKTINDLMGITEQDVLKIPGLGEKAVKDIKKALKKKKLELKS
ncbi:MAG: DNA-directed RNA polymerase subunit alpha [Candidatus Pacebacteria bacterium]|nr:DNA-directed RNA polymerase subunit alpha [Candidatus Paceibacterota bacterium]